MFVYLALAGANFTAQLVVTEIKSFNLLLPPQIRNRSHRDQDLVRWQVGRPIYRYKHYFRQLPKQQPFKKLPNRISPTAEIILLPFQCCGDTHVFLEKIPKICSKIVKQSMTWQFWRWLLNLVVVPSSWLEKSSVIRFLFRPPF